MALTDAQIIELKTEINNDPKVLGYSGKTDQEAADLMNTVGLSNETILKSSVSPEEILFALDYDEVVLLSTAKLQILTLYTGNGDVDMNNPLIQKVFKGLFGSGTDSRANLLALVTRAASRAEALFGEEVKYWDVARARAL